MDYRSHRGPALKPGKENGGGIIELIFTGTPEDLEAEIQAGRIQRTEKGLDITIEHKTELFLENKLLAVVQINGETVPWNPAKDRDPRITGNKNGGEKGAGFRFSPYFHKKGRFLQDVTKLGIIKAIDTAHKQILKYDKDAYQFEDKRLIKLDLFFRTFISAHFEDAGAGPRKLDFMYRFADIVLFLMKEDIYYRSRFFELFNDLPRSWELTEEEVKNIKNWD